MAAMRVCLIVFAFTVGACGQVSAPALNGNGDGGPPDNGDGGIGGDASLPGVCGECDSDNATCVQAASGAMECRCNAGYTGDGKTCSDVDECAFFGGGCDLNATCENRPGSHRCVCNGGFVGDGISCRSGLIFFANGSSGEDRFFRSYSLEEGLFQDEPLMAEANNDFCGCGYYHPGITAAGGGLFYFANQGQQFRAAWGPAAYPSDKQRSESGIAVLDDKIYFIGGRGPINNADVYDPASNSWSSISPYPIDIEWPAAGAVDGIIYVVGGTDDLGATDFFSAYDPQMNTWTTLDGVPFTDSRPYGIGAGGVFWVFALNTLYSYDGTWTNLGALPVGDAKPAAVGGQLYAVGDVVGANDIEIHHWSGDASSGSWELVDTDAGRLLGSWSHVGGTR